jgi:thiosulfate/3-mercaptopyruvate sulfurtransferase
MAVGKMAKLVDAEWVAARLESKEIVVGDPRRPMKYLSGHLPGAINIPMYKAFGADGKLLAPALLADFFAGAGLDDSITLVLYDSPEGQNAAMLAWILEYLGRRDVLMLDSYYENWQARGMEVRYKPVTAAATKFRTHEDPAIRATLAGVRGGAGAKLIDFRSHEEFIGERALGDDAPGHIPGAINIVWRDLASPPDKILAPREKIARIFAAAGIERDDNIVAYCRSGPRAALGYLALKEAGFDVRLFDGSYAEWSGNGLAAEK